MAPADKKKPKASKGKAAVVPQKSIFEMLMGQKAPQKGSNGDTIVSLVASEDDAELGVVGKETEIVHQRPPNPSQGSQKAAVPSSASSAIIDITDDDEVPESSSAQASRGAEGTSRHDPIVLSSSPIKPRALGTIDLTKPTYSIFAPRQTVKPIQSGSALNSNPGKGDKILEAPFPDRTAQHVRGLQTEFVAPSLELGRRQELETTPSALNSDSSDLSGFRERIMDRDYDIHSPPSKPIHYNEASNTHDYKASIPKEHIRSHPSINHLITLSETGSTEAATSSPQELWTEKWRPRRADHVLGNENHARYLRDWLIALEVQLTAAPESPQKPSTTVVHHQSKSRKLIVKEDRGQKRQRPQVIRAVTKSKGRKKQRIDSDDEDSWIVDSDDVEEPFDEEEDEEAEFALQSSNKPRLSRLRRMESSPAPASSPPRSEISHTPQTFTELHNTILIVGPQGSGKTAAVHACATELDFEVFEVYPGVGKRSGVSLDQLVGEVGKNHLVRTSKAGVAKLEGAKNAFAGMFSKAKEVHRSAAVGPDFMEIDVDTGSTAHADDASKTPQSVRQSLILLEEVDVLFEEDRGFWPAVISLIKDCKRPVIMTCNDITLVPTDDLPLQEILVFEPCIQSLSISYLQSICLAENRLIDKGSLRGICASSVRHIDSMDAPDGPLNPLTVWQPTLDLRKAIHHLQLVCSSLFTGETFPAPSRDEYLEDLCDWSPAQFQDHVPASATEPGKQSQVLRALSTHTETISFADSYLTRHALDTPEALAYNDDEPSPDDEMGHIQLFNASGHHSNALPFYNLDRMMLEDTIRVSRGTLAIGSTTDINPTSEVPSPRGLFRARARHQSQMLDLLWPDLVPIQTHLLPRPAVFLDYVPWIRCMAKIDDAFEISGDWESLNVNPTTRSGRPSRTAARSSSYVRQLTLLANQRAIIAATALAETVVEA